MEFLEGKDLRKRMLDGYARDPQGWSFVVSPSPGSGFLDATVSGPNETWLLKIDSMFKPDPIVIGAQAEPLLKRPNGPFPYGFRTLPPDLTLKIMGVEASRLAGDMRRRLLRVLRSEPVVPEMGRSYAQGPMILTGPERISLSVGQREVDAKLASEMRRLLRLRYPAYG